MEFEEQSNSGFAVAMSAPGRLNMTEKGIDSRLVSLVACTGARMHGPGLAKTNVDSAVTVFNLHCMQTLAAPSAAPQRSSSTVH